MDNKTIQLLCTGDLHLGRHPTRIPDRLDTSALSPRSVWQDVVREAIEQEVDAVVLTGDIADRENRYFEAYGAFEASVIDLADAGIPVVAVAGNHDSEFLPRIVDDIEIDSLHLLGGGETWERWTLEKNGRTAVHLDGWSFHRPHVPTSPLDTYDLPEIDGVPQIGVLHADLDSPRSQYAPVTSSELRNTPTSCWLLGHIHMPSIRIESDPTALYPGSPQALDPGERGTHGPWIVTVTSDKTVTTEQIPLGTVCYDEIRVDVSDCDGLQDTGSEVSAAMQQYVRETLDTRNLVVFLPRIRLTGRTPAHTQLVEGKQALEKQLAMRYESVDIQIESLTVDTQPDVDLDAIGDGDGPVSYLADLLSAMEDSDSIGEYNQMVEKVHGTMQRTHSADAYNLLRRESNVEEPKQDEAIKIIEQEARVLLGTLLQQKEDRQ